jgi:hypothetical protein
VTRDKAFTGFNNIYCCDVLNDGLNLPKFLESSEDYTVCYVNTVEVQNNTMELLQATCCENNGLLTGI